jgi:dihydroflavonol-4-reductase
MILVTGATGFLGAEVTKQLAANGDKVVCIKRAASLIPDILKPYGDKIKWFEADMLYVFALEDALQGVTQVYHCAAIVTFDPSQGKTMIKNNVEGTANIANLCNELNIRLMHVSSVAAIGEAKPGQLITENNHLEDTLKKDAYAISKYESEMEVWRGIAEGLNAVIVNPSMIIGRNAGVKGTGQIFEKVRTGFPYYTTGSIGYVDVEDVAKAMMALMNFDIKAERFIITAENWTYKDLFTQTAQGFGIKPPQKQATPTMLNWAWRLSSVWGFLTNRQVGIDKVSAQAASKNLDYSNAKIVKAIGIEFKPISRSIKEITAALSK